MTGHVIVIPRGEPGTLASTRLRVVTLPSRQPLRPDKAPAFVMAAVSGLNLPPCC